MTGQIRLNENVTFTTTADAGELEWQARALVSSLRREAPQSSIVVFIPSESKNRVQDENLAFYEEYATVVYGEMPIPEYPISAFLQAFVEGSKRATTEFIVALDTDTIAIDELYIPEADVDVWVRPADVGAQYWGAPASTDDWSTLYNHFSVPEPCDYEYTTSVIDGRRIPPYWNSGVVVTRDSTLAQTWLDVTCEMFENPNLPISPTEFFLDQISLAVVTRSMTVKELTESMNYPVAAHFTVPDSVRLLHYGDGRNLSRITNTQVRQKLSDAGYLPPLTVTGGVRTVLDVLSFHSGGVLSYESKQRVKSVVKKYVPKSIMDA